MVMTTSLPHWDMSVVYPGLDSPEFERDFSNIMAEIKTLAGLFDEVKIGKQESLPVDEASVKAFEQVINGLNQTLERVHTLEAYIYSFVATDSRDSLAQAKMSEFELGAVTLSQLETRLTAWIGSLDIHALLNQSSLAPTYAFMIRRAKEGAMHLMSPVEEVLASELELSGGSAWGKLHANLSSQIMVPVERGGKPQELPMSMVRNLAYNAEPETRRSAYEAELKSWEKAALPMAAALNSIKGEGNTLARHRGYATPLDEALFNNTIDRQTLEALHEATRASFPDFRRYLRAKARMLGKEKLPWYDLFAPVGISPTRASPVSGFQARAASGGMSPAGGRTWEFAEGSALVVEQFGGYSQRMGDFAQRAFRENWIDAEPRNGKQDGAFCMALRKDESRVLANYQPGFKSVLTLAHELGHGYHNLNRAIHPILNRDTPMTLAETSSIFCETIVRNALLKQVGAEERVMILEGALVNICQVVVDVTSRFIFESRVFAQRLKRELSVDELCELMVEAQKETYGDGLDPEVLHPYMWAVKSHYYSAGRSFYNFPYTFGLLFGLGLYARYQQDPEGFEAGYDDLLASTGLADPATLAGRMGIDIRSTAFWAASLDTIREDIDQFEQLAR